MCYQCGMNDAYVKGKIIFLMKSMLSVVYIARLSIKTRKLSVKVKFIDSNYH